MIPCIPGRAPRAAGASTSSSRPSASARQPRHHKTKSTPGGPSDERRRAPSSPVYEAVLEAACARVEPGRGGDGRSSRTPPQHPASGSIMNELAMLCDTRAASTCGGGGRRRFKTKPYGFILPAPVSAATASRSTPTTCRTQKRRHAATPP